MNESPTTHSSNSSGKLLWGLLKDHGELAALEWEYGKKQWWRRFLSKVGGAILFFSSFTFLNVASVSALMHQGLALYWIGLIFAGFYFVAGMTLLKWMAHKKKDESSLLEESRSEIKRSVAWIEKHFS